VNDKKLWKIFSQFIRLRDSNEEGVCFCFTCGRPTVWNKNTDCGHGIGRQHLSVKYSEQNNHAQCKNCNGFEGGKREVYKEKVDQIYGKGTWELLELRSKVKSNISQTDIDLMEKHYKGLVKNMLRQKGF
jgi:hypothetical protein